jgi:hypothetical protein
MAAGMRKRRPGGGGAADAIGKISTADDSADAIIPQALAGLAGSIACRRRTLAEQSAALGAAYAALQRANELAPAGALRHAALVALGHLAEDQARLVGLTLLERLAGLEGAR